MGYSGWNIDDIPCHRKEIKEARDIIKFIAAGISTPAFFCRINGLDLDNSKSLSRNIIALNFLL